MKKFLKTTRNDKLLSSVFEFSKFYNVEIANTNVRNSEKLSSEVAYRVARKILEVTMKHIVENDAGVVLDGFGYFALWKTPEKVKIRDLSQGTNKDFYYNHHTDGFLYLPHLFTEVYKNTVLKGWSMDGGFSKKIKTQISKNTRSGKRYALRLELIKSLKLKYNNKRSRQFIKSKKW